MLRLVRQVRRWASYNGARALPADGARAATRPDAVRSYIITGGADGKICIFKGITDTSPVTVNEHSEPINAIAVFVRLRVHRRIVVARPSERSAACGQNSKMVSGSDDNTVKMFGFPDGVFEENVTRFTLPVRTITFNASGTQVAVGSECVVAARSSDGPCAAAADGPVRAAIR